MRREQIESWLRTRVPARPEPLARQMSRLVAGCPEATLAGPATMSAALGMLGLHTLSGVTGPRPDDERLAMELLAADAFVTYAFEAAAEEEVAMAPFALWLVREAA